MYMSDQAVILPKWFSYRGIILAKEKLDHSDTYWIMPIMIFSQVYFFLVHPLVWKTCRIADGDVWVYFKCFDQKTTGTGNCGEIHW